MLRYKVTNIFYSPKSWRVICIWVNSKLVSKKFISIFQSNKILKNNIKLRSKKVDKTKVDKTKLDKTEIYKTEINKIEVDRIEINYWYINENNDDFS